MTSPMRSIRIDSPLLSAAPPLLRRARRQVLRALRTARKRPHEREVHDLRVRLRALLALLDLLSPAIAPYPLARARRWARRINHRLARARAAAVRAMILESLPDCPIEVLEAARAELDQAPPDARSKPSRARRVLGELVPSARWGVRSRTPLDAALRDALSRWRDQLAPTIDYGDHAAVHAARLAVKHARYALQSVRAPLGDHYPATRGVIEQLRSAQDALGTLADLDDLGRWLARAQGAPTGAEPPPWLARARAQGVLEAQVVLAHSGQPRAAIEAILRALPVLPAPPRRARAPTRHLVAVVEVGSSSVRLLVARSGAGGVEVLARERASTRLARAAGPDSKEARETLDAIARLARVAREGHACERLVLAGTAAVRAHAAWFSAPAGHAAGVPLLILSEDDEGALAWESACEREPDPAGEPTLVVDVGGASTELVQGARGVAVSARSFPLGTLTLRERFPEPSRAGVDAMRAHAKELFGGARWVRGVRPGRVLVAGGTARSLVACGGSGNDLRRALVEGVLREWAEGGDPSRGVLGPDKLEVLGAGACIVLGIMDVARVDAVRVVEGGVAHGLARRRLAREDGLSARDHAEALLELSGTDAAHARRVERLALRLLEVLGDDAGEVERALLSAAALAHDVGWMVGEVGHHRHGEGIARLWGWGSREGRELVARLMRAHRGDRPLDVSGLEAGSASRAGVLAGILRLADGLDRARVDGVDVTLALRGEGVVRLGVSGLEGGSLRRALRGAHKKREWLERALGVRIECAGGAGVGRENAGGGT